MKKEEKVAVKETITFEVVESDPGIAHHLDRLRDDAKKSKKTQRFVLMSGMTDDGIGERVLTVKPNGSYTVTFEPGE